MNTAPFNPDNELEQIAVCALYQYTAVWAEFITAPGAEWPRAIATPPVAVPRKDAAPNPVHDGNANGDNTARAHDGNVNGDSTPCPCQSKTSPLVHRKRTHLGQVDNKVFIENRPI